MMSCELIKLERNGISCVKEFCEKNGFNEIVIDDELLYKYNYNVINKVNKLNVSPHHCCTFYEKDDKTYMFMDWEKDYICFIDVSTMIRKG